MIRVAIVGASGYTGGELLRLLIGHPGVEIAQVTSESRAGEPVGRCHPNLRRRTELRFSAAAELQPCDTLFACLPHGETMKRVDELRAVAERVVDLSADFRLRSAEAYRRWYGEPHARPDLLGQFVYGIPELHRAEMRDARLVSSAGCNATAVILALAPLVKAGAIDRERTVVEVKVGSSEAGAASSPASHHPERANSLRSYKPTGHRHTAEIEQELSNGQPLTVHMSATALDMVRGVLATCHVFLEEDLDEKAIWRLYRQAYGDEPFVRIVKERDGAYRYPEPKLLLGTNGCDVGFEMDERGGRVVVIAALDNLMKGAAGQALQAFNLMHGFPETTGLEFAGLHPL